MAFLYADLEKNYVECPQGILSIKTNNCIILNKFIYGLIQLIRQHYKKAIKILKNSGFIGGSIDQCLYMKKKPKVTVYIALYTDNNLMMGNIAALDGAKDTLKNEGLALKIVEELQDNLSCEIILLDNKKRAWSGNFMATNSPPNTDIYTVDYFFENHCPYAVLAISRNHFLTSETLCPLHGH